MKIFRIVKKVFFLRLAILSNFTNALDCISMKNREYKVRPEILVLIVIILCFIWNPSNCECECDKNCDFNEYLDYENCKCRKKLIDKLINEGTEIIEEVKLAKITPMELNSAENENENKYSSCRAYIVLMIVLFTICIGITTYFVYYHRFLIKNVSCIKFNTHKETKIW